LHQKLGKPIPEIVVISDESGEENTNTNTPVSLEAVQERPVAVETAVEKVEKSKPTTEAMIVDKGEEPASSQVPTLLPDVSDLHKTTIGQRTLLEEGLNSLTALIQEKMKNQAARDESEDLLRQQTVIQLQEDRNNQAVCLPKEISDQTTVFHEETTNQATNGVTSHLEMRNNQTTLPKNSKESFLRNSQTNIIPENNDKQTSTPSPNETTIQVTLPEETSQATICPDETSPSTLPEDTASEIKTTHLPEETTTLSSESTDNQNTEEKTEEHPNSSDIESHEGELSQEPVGEEYIKVIEPTRKMPRGGYRCILCQCVFNDEGARKLHVQGRKHRNMYKQRVKPGLKVDVKPSRARQRAKVLEREKSQGKAEKDKKPTSSNTPSTSKPTSSKSSHPSNQKPPHHSPKSRSQHQPPSSRRSTRDHHRYHHYGQREHNYQQPSDRLSDYQRSERYTEPFGDTEWYYGSANDMWLFETHSEDSRYVGEEMYYDTGYYGDDRAYDMERYEGFEEEDYDDDYHWDRYRDGDMYDEERGDYFEGDDQRGYDMRYHGYSNEEGYEEGYNDEEWPYDGSRQFDEGYYDYADDWFGDEMEYDSGAIDPLF
jgi:hypothetical protein